MKTRIIKVGAACGLAIASLIGFAAIAPMEAQAASYSMGVADSSGSCGGTFTSSGTATTAEGPNCTWVQAKVTFYQGSVQYIQSAKTKTRVTVTSPTSDILERQGWLYLPSGAYASKVFA